MSEQEKGPGGMSRRDFLKLMGAAGTSVAFAPFVPWGKFMPNPSSSVLEKVPVILPDGTQANLNTFPVNHAEVITYPETADEVLNEEAFRNGSLSDFLKNSVEKERMYLHLEHTVWFVFIYGVYGSTGQTKDE